MINGQFSMVIDHFSISILNHQLPVPNPNLKDGVSFYVN